MASEIVDECENTFSQGAFTQNIRNEELRNDTIQFLHSLTIASILASVLRADRNSRVVRNVESEMEAFSRCSHIRTQKIRV